MCTHSAEGAPVGTQQSPPFQRRILGKKLRELRAKAGLKAAETAQQLEISTGRLSRIENGEVAPDIPLAKYLLDLYGIPVNDWEPWLEQVRSARKTKGWWQAYSGPSPRGYAGLETAATAIRTYEITHVPGLLQTEAYARTLFRAFSADQRIIENRVTVRMIRQKRLYVKDDQLDLTCVIDEGVLTRPVGSPAVMKEQLDHLVLVSGLPNVILQVVPQGRGFYSGMEGAFTLLSFESEPDLVYIENVLGGSMHEKESELRSANLAFARIHAAALAPEASAEFIRQVARRL